MGTRCVVALGANLGDRSGALRSAVAALAATPGIRVTRASPVVITRAVGGPADSPDYHNAVVELSVELTPHEVLRVCQEIELEHGRERPVHWGPRTLDLDVIWFDGVELDDPHLTLPHPRARERAFVLVPWALMDPSATLGDQLVRELAERAPDIAGLTHTDLTLAGEAAADAHGATGVRSTDVERS